MVWLTRKGEKTISVHCKSRKDADELAVALQVVLDMKTDTTAPFQIDRIRTDEWYREWNLVPFYERVKQGYEPILMSTIKDYVIIVWKKVGAQEAK